MSKLLDVLEKVALEAATKWCEEQPTESAHRYIAREVGRRALEEAARICEYTGNDHRYTTANGDATECSDSIRSLSDCLNAK